MGQDIQTPLIVLNRDDTNKGEYDVPYNGLQGNPNVLLNDFPSSDSFAIAMTDGTYPLFSIFAFLGFLLPLIPLPWHLEALNSATCFFIMWSSLACLNQFVNSLVWAGNVLNPAPWWCEISIRIMMGTSVGIPAASLCINRRLYYIASVQTATITLAEKYRAIVIDSLICVLFPLIYVALQYVVQGHRFNIFEDIGCYPALYNTLLTFFISSMWPILLGLISAVYCVLSLRSFSRRRAEFSQFLSSNTTLTLGRYFRLMALAMTEICATTPLAIFMIWLNATASPVGPWRSWDDTHFAYSRVEQIPAIFWRSNHLLVIAIEFSRWVTPLCSLIFFGFFGFAHEARRHYRLLWTMTTGLISAHSPFCAPSSGSSKHKVPLSGDNLSAGCISKQPVSPTSFSSTAKNPHRSYSFSTSASTHVDGNDDVELRPYKYGSHPTSDVEKSVDLPREDAETATTYTRDAVPGYYAPYNTSSTLRIGVPIDANRGSSSRPSLPEIEIDDSDTFTISTFSYYGGSPSSPPSSPSTLPPQPSPTDVHHQHSLPPPPRRKPRSVPSSGSMSMSPVVVPGVPEDVGPSSYTPQAVSPLDDLPQRPMGRTNLNGRTLGVPGGSIIVTIQRQASVDGLA